MNTKIFMIDYSRLIQLLLPTFLRKPLMTFFLQSLIAPVMWLHDNSFKYSRENNLFKISITSSVCRLEYLLNTRYYPEAKDLTTDRTATRIFISDVEAHDVLYIYQAVGEIPEKDVPILYTVNEIGKDSLFLYTKSETGRTVDDFVVITPNNLRDREAEMSSLLRSYALPDKQYSFNYF